MAYDNTALKEEFNPLKKGYEYIKYKIDFIKEHPNYFYADGLIIFTGMQGTGKTLSAVNYVYNLMKKYPLAKLVTNLYLTDYPIVTLDEFIKENTEKLCLDKLDYPDIFEIYKKVNRVFPFNNQDDLEKYNNGELGVIYLIDEIQLYFNSLESKNINIEVMVQISQQRKQRKHIVATSQVFGRMAKPLREQFSNVVVCSNYFKFLQCNKVVNRDDIEEQTDDMHVQGKVSQKSWYIHTPRYYKRYDTYYTIARNKFVSNEKRVGDIYDSRNVTTNNRLDK